MEITHYLIQRAYFNGNDDFETYNQGKLIQSGKNQYFIEFFASQEAAITAEHIAFNYSALTLRITENELNSAIIDCLKKRYKDIDTQWLCELIESNSGYEDLEQQIIEYMEAVYEAKFFNYEDIVQSAREHIAEVTLSGVYKVGAIARIGEIIKLDGINAILELINKEPGSEDKYPMLHEILTDFKVAADRVSQTKAQLDVNGTEYAAIFRVADKGVVSQWCNAIRKPDNFRLEVMNYMIENPNTGLIKYLAIEK
jgi:hypothetical protein